MPEETYLGMPLQYFTPLIMFMFNQVFIPTLVNQVSYYEEYETKSQRHKNNLYKQFFYMSINTIFLPITGLATIEKFLESFTHQTLTQIPLQLSQRILKSSEFFLRYIIQLTFISNIIQLLDLPHYFYLCFKKKVCRRKRKSSKESKLEDDWFFDIGYHFAFSITIFTLVFLFSTAVPLIPIFGFLYFAFKVNLSLNINPG